MEKDITSKGEGVTQGVVAGWRRGLTRARQPAESPFRGQESNTEVSIRGCIAGMSVVESAEPDQFWAFETELAHRQLTVCYSFIKVISKCTVGNR